MSTLAGDSIRWITRRPVWARLLVGLLFGGAGTLAALAVPQTKSTTIAAMVYLAAVVAASLLGRLAGGLAASVFSFLGLNFFFTDPRFTFRVEKQEDIVALIVLLTISFVVANLFTQLLSQRERAEQRENESRLLYRLTSRLLRGETGDLMLREFTRELTGLFDLAACRVFLGQGGELRQAAEFTSQAAQPSDAPIEVALETERRRLGIVRLIPQKTKRLDDRQRAFVVAFAGQVALAIEAAQLLEQTREARSEAETSRIRAALFSSISHDLRTPLSSIKASATSLLEEGVRFDDGQKQELLRTIAEESDRLNRLINNLLELSRMRSGAVVLSKIPTPIEDVIQAVVGRLRGVLAGRSVTVRLKENLPAVPMDVLQIDQVVSNLMENARAHTPPGTDIEIRAKKWHSNVEVEIADRGPGIPEEQRELVFKEFFRRSTGSSDSGAGAGLGLSIALAIVQAHGGEMWISNTPGGGATLGFRLPAGETVAP